MEKKSEAFSGYKLLSTFDDAKSRGGWQAREMMEFSRDYIVWYAKRMLSQEEICGKIDIRKEIDKIGGVTAELERENIGRGWNRYIVECKDNF